MIVESYEDVIVLSGALRSNFWETIQTAISLMLKRHPSGVVLDCSGITEVTPAGADTFRDIIAFISDQDARVILAKVPPAAMEVLKAVPEVRSQLAVAGSVDEARRSLDLLANEDQAKKKKTGPVAVSQKLIVALRGDANDRDALELVSEIADTIRAEIHVVYVIQVPRDLPLQAPLPDKEERASQGLDTAKRYLTMRKVAHTENLSRARDVGSAIDDVLKDVDASHVVVPLSSEENAVEDEAKLVRTLLARINQTLIFVRAPLRS